MFRTRLNRTHNSHMALTRSRNDEPKKGTRGRLRNSETFRRAEKKTWELILPFFPSTSSAKHQPEIFGTIEGWDCGCQKFSPHWMSSGGDERAQISCLRCPGPVQIWLFNPDGVPSFHQFNLRFGGLQDIYFHLFVASISILGRIPFFRWLIPQSCWLR